MMQIRKGKEHQGRMSHSSDNRSNQCKILFNIEVYRPDNSREVSVQALNAFFEDTGLTLDQLTGKAPIQNMEVDTWKTYKFGKSLYNPAALNEWVRKCTCSTSGTCRRVAGVSTGSLSDLETIITSVAVTSYILVSKNCINYTTWTLWTNQSLAPFVCK